MRSWGKQVLVCDLKMLNRGVTYGILSVSMPSFAITHANNFFLEQLELEFLFWKHLHGLWQTLLNFNPYTALSEPGQDVMHCSIWPCKTHRVSMVNSALRSGLVWFSYFKDI